MDLLLGLLVIVAVASSGYADPITLLELLKQNGYEGERFTVSTEDGYILGVYHITAGRNDNPQKTKPPLVLWHGFESNSIDFLNAGPYNGLGFILTDEGYDVWLPNNRGNFESTNHTILSGDSEEYWDYSWHEIGKYDLPAVIDFVLEKTGEPKVHFIGYSQGTTSFFVYASLYPEESARKVISMHALAPVAFVKHAKSPVVQFTSGFFKHSKFTKETFGVKNIPKSRFTTFLEKILRNLGHQNNLLNNFMFMFGGFDEEQFNSGLLPIITQNDPAGSSTKQLEHYAQLVNSGKFRQYDYGSVKNQEMYSQKDPPDYDIEKINVTIHLHYSDNDWVVAVKDVMKFASMVNTSILHRVPFPKFNHFDFIWAKDPRPLLFDKVVKLLNSNEV